MRYVALLRGINVGGRNKVPMARLAATFEGIGAREVRTFIASGNVVFDHRRSAARLVGDIEAAIEAEFGFPVSVVVRTGEEMRALAASIPADWVEDASMRCYVMFLWEDVDDPSVLERVTIVDGLDDVLYHPGALVWRVDRDVLTRSGMMRLTKDALYKRMSIRNVNTVRSLVEMVEA